ncbi:MAG: hypothetical protein Q9216_000305 [Gyalolechia sp. 2 TL-2023]
MLLTRSQFFWRTSVCKSCRTLSTSCRTKVGERRASEQLPSTPARTRFAPSPTGYLHLGSLRTALFNFLLAKATGGLFLLRIEDTDKRRTIADAEERLYDDLRWCGLNWDEGPDIGGPYGPYRQSERTNLYLEHSKKLLQSGHAYRCFCSSEKLNELARRRASLGLPSDYDRTCEGISVDESDERASTGEAFVIRLKVPAEPPEYVDLVYGLVGKPNRNKKAQKHGEILYEDAILLKSDGMPTYHLANVVDDHHMKITHVVRAAEWMSSTPKHLLLYDAFGWKPPEFAHVGLLQDSSQQKFSKRKGGLNIRRFEEQGIFPEALLNYVALYGWSHTKTSDVMSLSDLVESFDLRFTKGNTVVEPHKLMYLQKKYAANLANANGPEFETLVDRVFKEVQQEFETPLWHPERTYPGHLLGQELRTRIADVLRHTAKNYTTIEEFFNNHIYLFYNAPFPEIDHPGEMHATCEDLWPRLQLVNVKFREVLLKNWTDAGLKETTTAIVNTLSRELDKSGKEMYKIIQFYLRWAIARGGSGPPMHTTMALLGRDTCLQRLDELAAMMDSNPKKATRTDSQ